MVEAGLKPALRVQNLRKAYKDVVAVDGLDLEVPAGECFGLLGPNGAGKTTTIEICEGLTAADSGEVEVLGLSWRSDGAELRQRLGIQLQETQLSEKLTVHETIRLFRSFFRQGPSPAEVIGLVQLEEKRNSRVGALSGGQKQRLALACALVGKPDLLFLDEPTTGLDPQARRQLWELIEEMKKAGTTIVLTTHYMDEAERLCDRVAIIEHGRIIDMGGPSELVDRHCPARRVVLTSDAQDGAEWFARIPNVLGVTQKGSTFTLDGNGDDFVSEVITCLSTHQMHVTSFRTVLPTLEDVFLRLTGHSIRD